MRARIAGALHRRGSHLLCKVHRPNINGVGWLVVSEYHS